MGDRCTGHCCRRFYLPLKPEELARAFEAHQRGEVNYDQIELVAPMVVSLEPHESGTGHWYTCRHLNVMTGDCTNYENRPRLCSGYPDYGQGGGCSYAECTWDEMRAPRAVSRSALLREVDKMKQEIADAMEVVTK